MVSTMGLCACSGVCTHYTVSAYFCAQSQKLLNVSADGEMFVADIFYAKACFAAVRAGNTVGRNMGRFVPVYSSLSLSHLNSWEPIEKYINEQYEKFLKEEVNIARKKRIPDTRVHCCLYFISPTGHSYVHNPSSFLKPLVPPWQIYTLHCSVSAMDPRVLLVGRATV